MHIGQLGRGSRQGRQVRSTLDPSMHAAGHVTMKWRGTEAKKKTAVLVDLLEGYLLAISLITWKSAYFVTLPPES